VLAKEVKMNTNLIKMLVKKENPVFLEIGAHRGTETLKFLRNFPAIDLYCFEPDPRALLMHRAAVQDERCKLFEIAVSDENGEATFYQSSGKNTRGGEYNASSSLRVPKEHLNAYPDCIFEDKITVKTVTLDTWAKEHQIGLVDFIWVDVQGAEDKLIKGAQEVLAKSRYFFTEFYDREMYAGQTNLRGLIKLLPDFKLVCLYGNNVLFKNMVLDSSEIALLKERMLTNYYIYQHDRGEFRLPLKTGIRRLLAKIKDFS
jgi:FkbM family methyltransferase